MVLNKRSSRAPRTLATAGTWCAVAVAAAVALSGCITVPNNAEPTATQGPTAPQGYVERLKATPVAQATGEPGAGDLPQFVSDTRNIACVFTTSRAGNLNQPWEPNNFSDGANAAAPLVPVVNCQMAGYPPVGEADKVGTCSGTHVGYLGGTALLDPEKAVYGGCRAGVTAVEAAFGPRGTVSQQMGEIPVLAQGSAMEAQGYRCAPLDDGVACANLATGTGFFISAGKYQIFGAEAATPAPKA